MRQSWSATLWCAGIFTMTLGLAVATAHAPLSQRDTQRPPARSPATEQKAAQPAATELDFVSRVAMSNMAAIQLGHMASKKAQHADVQKFAQTTIDGYLKAQQQLADDAYGAGVQWPKKLDDRHRQLQERLSKLSKEQFDREYMKAMIDWHHEVEKMLAGRANNRGEGDGQPTGGPGDAKSDEAPLAAKVDRWAARTLPEVRNHLKEAEQVFGELDKGE
jgi:predicted outer membrane protein